MGLVLAQALVSAVPPEPVPASALRVCAEIHLLHGLKSGRAGCISVPLFVGRGETPDSCYGFGVPSGVQSIVFRKENLKFLRVLYLEVEKCKGKYVAQDKSVFLESARDVMPGWEARCLAERLSHSPS